MVQYYIAPVKIYSRCLQLTQAPFGFEGAYYSLDPKHWIHIPADSPITFSILITNENKLTFKVGKLRELMECIEMDLYENNKVINFSARSPSISCKYLICNGRTKYIKRFQLTFQNENDFSKVLSTLSYLKLSVKNARPTIPISIPNPQTPQPSEGTDTMRKITSQVLEMIHSQPPNVTCNEGFSIESFNTQSGAPGGNLADHHDHHAKNVAILQNKLSNFTTKESVNKIITKTIPPKPSLNMGNYDMQTVVSKQHHPEQKPLTEVSLKLSDDYSLQKPDQDKFNPQNPDITAQDSVKAAPLTKCTQQDMLLGLQENIVSHKSKNTGSSFISDSDIKNERERPISRQKPSGSERLKISKKFIKKRLNDERFMKWVAKVESVLSEFSKPSKQNCYD